MDESINKANIVDKILITLSNKDILIQLLKVYEISDIDKITDIQRYEREDNRKGLILKVKETHNRDPIKILIDIKPGQPSIDQVYSAVYEEGVDCDKRIIMYTGGKSEGDEENLTADQYVMESLANAMNEFPVGLYLVKKSESILSKGFMDFLVIAEPYGTPKFKEKDLPSKQQFLELEFWQVYFWSLYDGLYRPWEAFSDGLIDKFNYGFSLPIKNLKVAVQWTKKEGVYYTVSREDDDYHALEEVWIEKENIIRTIFDRAEVDMRKDPGKLPRIKIKYWKFPPTVLLNATIEEKKDYAETLYRKFWALFGVIESV